MAEVERRGVKFIKDNEVEDNISQIADFFVGETPKFGLFIAGLYGGGKTTMTRAIENVVKYLIGKDYLHFSEKMTFVTATEYAGMVEDDDVYEVKRIRGSRSLIIDDLGREPSEIKQYGNTLNPLISLLDHRYEYQMLTVVSSNLTIEEIGQKYGERMIDRFSEMFEIVVFKNDSYR